MAMLFSRTEISIYRVVSQKLEFFFFYCAGSLLQHTGFSLVAVHSLPSCGARALEHAASVVTAQRLSSCHVLA